MFWVFILRVMFPYSYSSLAFDEHNTDTHGFHFLSSSSPRLLAWDKTDAMAVVSCTKDCTAFLLNCLVSALTI